MCVYLQRQLTIQSTFETNGADGISISRVIFESDALLESVVQSAAITILTPIARPAAELRTSFDPTNTFATVGGKAMLLGFLGNEGTTDFSWDRLVFGLPKGWTVTDDKIRVGGVLFACSASCGTENPEFDITTISLPDSQQSISVEVTVPGDTCNCSGYIKT